MSKIISYNPDPEVWDGHVEIEVPDYAARVSHRTEFAKLTGDNVKLMDKARELALKYTKAVALTHKETGTVVDSLDYIDFYEECEDIYSAIGLCVAKGPKMGNVLATQ